MVLEHITVLEDVGPRADQAPLIEELERHTDPTVQMHGRMARLQMRISTDPHAVIEEAERVSQEALEVFGSAGDELGLARTWYLLFWIEWLQSRAGPALAALDRLAAHADRAGARALAARSSIYMMGPLLFGPFPVDAVRARLDRLRRIGGPIATNTVLRVEAHLARLEGRFEEALALHDEADRLVANLGMTVTQAIEKQWPTEVMLVQGRTAESIAILRASVAELEALGETSFRSTTVVRLGEALYQLGETEEAERLAIEGEQLGAVEDVVNFAMGRGVRARIAADRGEHDAAERLARDALRYAYKTDFPAVHAQAHTSLAYVLKLADRTDEARAELESGIAAFESYGNAFEAERTRGLLVQL
jgi:tetratricopeptide (TPR) repeat protein